MSDLQRQLREYYERRPLSDERTRAVLEAGRVAAKRARGRRWLLGAAAVLVIAAGLFGVARFRDRGRIAPDDAALAVMNFFSQPDYQLPRVSGDASELARWLREQGAPASFTIPKPFADLPSFGCQILDVRGQRVFLICFFLDGTAAESAAGGMMKKEMTVTGPDGTMMKKTRPLVHLVVAPRSAFRDPPQPGTRVSLSPVDAWNFQSWSQGDLVYLVAAAAPLDQLATFTPAL